MVFCKVDLCDKLGLDGIRVLGRKCLLLHNLGLQCRLIQLVPRNGTFLAEKSIVEVHSDIKTKRFQFELFCCRKMRWLSLRFSRLPTRACTVKFNEKFPKSSFVRLLSCSLVNLRLNLKRKGQISSFDLKGVGTPKTFLEAHYTLESIAQGLEDAFKNEGQH